MSARTAATVALLSVASVAVSATVSASSPASTTTSSTMSPLTAPTEVPEAAALYPLDEFIGRWNEANSLVAEQMSPSVQLPIDASALVVRPVNERVSFFDWHFPGSGYVGGLVDAGTGDVYLGLVAGEPDSPMMRSATGTLLFMLTAERPDDSAALSDAYVSFAADPRPGATAYAVAGSLGVSMLAFDGLEPGTPWIVVAAASPTDEQRALVEAATVAQLVADTTDPPAPAPELPSAVPSTDSVPAGLATGAPSAATTTVPVPPPPPTTAAAVPIPAATSVFPSVDAFVAAWNAAVGDLLGVDPTLELFTIDPAAILRQPMPPGELLQGFEAFSVPIATSGFVGGLIDQATGQVTGVLVGGDPDAQVVRGSVGVLLLSSLDPSTAAEAAAAWAALAADTSTVRVESVVAGDLSVTLEVVAGAEADDNLVSVFIGPIPTTPEQVAAPVLAYVAIFSLALSAPPAIAAAPTTVAAQPTTTAIAALPTTAVQVPTTAAPIATTAAPVPTTTATIVATAVPTTVAAPTPAPPPAPPTTGLPQVSLAPPSPTAASTTVPGPPPTTVPGPPPTTAAPIAGALFASIADLAARWNERAAGASLSGDDISVSLGEMVLVVVGAPRDVFAGWINDTAYLGGYVDPATENVSSLAVVVVPSSASAVDVLFTTADLVAPDYFAEFMSAYTGVLGSPPGTNVYLRAGANDLVFSVIGPPDGSRNLIAVTAALATDEATAVANAVELNETLPNTLLVL